MRSVMRNPPATLHMAAATAATPRTVRTASYCSPATTMAPTTEMAEMALVADMSGVCSRVGTPWMTWWPTKAASTNSITVHSTMPESIRPPP